MRNNTLLLGIVGIIIVIGVGFVILNFTSKKQAPSTTTTTGGNNENVVQVKETTPVPTIPIISTVKLTASGFSPASIRVTSGTLVTFINESGAEATVSSDNHPTHQLFPVMNLGQFDSGSSVQARMNNVGTYTYHNHFKPEQKGTIVVE